MFYEASVEPLPFGPIPSPVQRSSMARRLLVLGGVVAVVSACGGYSFRLYVDRAKTREARTFLKKLGDGAGAAYRRDGKLCPTGDFACIGLEPAKPRRYHYSYQATDAEFTATGVSYLREDERRYRLRISGHVEGGRLVVGRVQRDHDPDPDD